MFFSSSLIVLASTFFSVVSASPIVKRTEQADSTLVIADLTLIQNAMTATGIDLFRQQLLQTDSTDVIGVDTRSLLEAIFTASDDFQDGGILDDFTASIVIEVFTDGLTPQVNELSQFMNQQQFSSLATSVGDAYEQLVFDFVTMLPSNFSQVLIPV